MSSIEDRLRVSLRHLRAENTELLAEIDGLRREMGRYRDLDDLASRFPPRWKLSPREAQCLAAIRRANGQVVAGSVIFAALRGERARARHRDIAVFVIRLRNKLAKANAPVEIKSVHAQGYFLDADSIVALDALTRAEGRLQ